MPTDKSRVCPKGKWEWLNSTGITVKVFKYLSPAEGGVDLQPPDEAFPPIFLLTTWTV